LGQGYFYALKRAKKPQKTQNIAMTGFEAAETAFV
jgi:hypothetical protein